MSHGSLKVGLLLAMLGLSDPRLALAETGGSSPQEMNARQLQDRGAALLARGDYAHSIPYLEHLVEVLEQTAPGENKILLEKTLLSLALARMETDDAKAAEQVLNRILVEFPRSSQRRLAEWLMVEAMLANSRWEPVLNLVDRLLSEPDLTGRERLMLNHWRGEALYLLERWDAAMEPLTYVFRQSPDAAVRNEVAVRIAICQVRSQPLDSFFRFWRRLERLPARHDARLALSLLEVADRHHTEGRHREALLLYRIVSTKSELETHIQQQLEQLQQARLRGRTGNNSSLAMSNTRRRQIERRIQRLKVDLEDLARVEEFAPAIQLRSGRIYLSQQRYAEACLLFRAIYQGHPQHELAEEAMYSNFVALYQAGEADRALAAGERYLRAYRGGRFWDGATLALAGLYLDQQQWQQAVDVARDAVEVLPDHAQADQLLYLSGYALFQLENFSQARDQFARLRSSFPQSPDVEPGHYWQATCQLFLSEYQAAVAEYEQFLAAFGDGEWAADALYRLALAQSGAGNTAAARQTLERFPTVFPDHSLAAEVYNALGDLQAADGAVEDAVTAFTRATETAQQAVQVDYATFQLARLYHQQERHDEVIRLCRGYLAKQPGTAGASQASYWLGRAQRALNQRATGLETFFEAIARHGNQPGHHGVDLILRDLIRESTGKSLDISRAEIRQRLRQELDRARAGHQRTAELRLMTALAETARDPDRRLALITRVLDERDFVIVSPLSLVVMARELRLRQLPRRAREACEYLLEHHPESEWVGLALAELAELKIETNQYDEALTLLRKAIDRSPAGSLCAGAATRREGDVYRRLGQPDEAMARYASVLAVRAWRGELWPASLFAIGDTLQQQGLTEKAFAYYQRVYVLYEGYPQWAARAYLQSARCLERLGQLDQAAATYREMLSKRSLAGFPECKSAQEALARLTGER